MNSPPENWFLSMYFPQFPAQVAACWDYDLWGKPYVITRQRTHYDRSIVIAVSPSARRYGIHEGMPVQKVKMKYRKVKILKENEKLRERAKKEITFVCRQYTPNVVGQSSRGMTTLDLTGTKSFWGIQYQNLADILQQQLREQIGFRTICMGLGQSPYIAQLCARSAQGNQIKKMPERV